MGLLNRLVVRRQATVQGSCKHPFLQSKAASFTAQPRPACKLDEGAKKAAGIALTTGFLLLGTPAIAAELPSKLPPIKESPERCTIQTLENFADTRAAFSQEASGGNMTEAIVDVRNCDFSNLDLSGKVMSGVFASGANFENSKFVGSQWARADARGANLKNVDFTDTNCYGSAFNGADLQGAQFENAILTGATFGKDPETGNWANLKGAHFEGALLSSSDVVRVCQNPTLELNTKKYELGCRSTK